MATEAAETVSVSAKCGEVIEAGGPAPAAAPAAANASTNGVPGPKVILALEPPVGGGKAADAAAEALAEEFPATFAAPAIEVESAPSSIASVLAITCVEDAEQSALPP